MSVFRITRAEFSKVFKKPMVYIMAFLLAVVLVITLLSYSPTQREVKSVSIEGDNASSVYDVFMSNSATADNKSKFDAEYFTYVDKQIDFYNNLYLRTNNLQKAFNELNSSYIEFSNTFTANNNDSTLESKMLIVKNNFDKVLSTYGNVSAFVNYDGLNNIVKSLDIKGLPYLNNKFFDVTESKNTYNYDTLFNIYIPILKAENTAKSFKTYIDTNKFIDIFKNLTEYGQNIIYNILNDIISEIQSIQNNFCELVKGDLSVENKKLINQKAIDLHTKVTQFKKLVDGLTNNGALFALHTSKSYSNLINAYDSFIAIYDTMKVDNINDYTSKEAGAIALKNSDYILKFQKYLNSISFMEINEEFIKTLKKHESIVNKNKTSLLELIEKNKTEISTAPILEDITNYMLLGETYKEVVNCEIVGQLSKNLPLTITKDIKNFDLSNYNSYNNQNTITTLTYQLENNIYHNSVGGVLSLNETMSSQKNMYDFTYYALKIATLLITIFTIMMIANLITSETDSGTIKLLLIRPYKRGTVLWGKILATFFFSFSFLLLSFVISMVAGYFMFGAPLIDSVLVTFNATTTFITKPIYLILLFLLSCTGDILFYLIIALTISVLYKSYIGAISTSLIIYIGAMVVGSFLSGSTIYAYLPFTNISWFRFFGGEIMPFRSGLAALLASPVHSLQSFSLSVGISCVFSILLLIITFSSFKRRDF